MNDEDKMRYMGVGLFVMLVLIGGMWGIMIYGDATRESISSNKGQGLKAIVKGSIYGEGEMMSVFGTCTNEYDMPVNASGYFQAWYPNGTQFLFNDSVANIATGYYVWNGPMSAVGGTYLTEFDCVMNNETAKAWGEWQNPVWVSKIGYILNFTNATQLLITDMNGNIIGINATVNEISSLLQNLSIGNLSVDLTSVLDAISNLSIQVSQGNNATQSMIISGFNNTQLMITSYMNNLTLSMVQNFTYTDLLISQGFNSTAAAIVNLSTGMASNITFLQQNMTASFNYTNNLILSSNQSWQSNTTLIAQLLYQLLNQTSTLIQNNLTAYVIQADGLVYWTNWNVKIGVRDSIGRQLSSPEVYCYLNNTLTGMQLMTTEGSHFTTTVFINQNAAFNWNPLCYYS